MRVTVSRSVAKVIVLLPAIGFLWLVSPFFQAFAAAPLSQAANVDPRALPARYLKIKISGGSGLSPRPFRPHGSSTISRRYWIFSAEFSGQSSIRSPPSCVGLFGAFTGAGSGGAVVVWLIIVAFLAGSIWKLYPVIADWLTGGGPEPGLRHAVASQALAEAPFYSNKPAWPSATECMLTLSDWLCWPHCAVRETRSFALRHNADQPRVPDRAAPHVGAGRALGQLARIYDRVWYGRVTPDRAAAELAINLCRSMINWEGPTPA